jgi:hypothetical protein
MAWNGEERRSGKDRRIVERRRATQYRVDTVVIIGGITWVDPGGKHRRAGIRRREDREAVARIVVQLSRP